MPPQVTGDGDDTIRVLDNDEPDRPVGIGPLAPLPGERVPDEPERTGDPAGPAFETFVRRSAVAGDSGEDSGEYDLAPDPDPPKPLPRSKRPATVEVERHCRRCGYDLRGLPADGRCPECGTPIADSGAGESLAFADADWLRRVALGCRVIFAAIAGGTLAGAAAAWAGGPAAQAAVAVASGVLSVAGVWLATAGERGDRRPPGERGRRVAARALIFASPAAAVLGLLAVTSPAAGQATRDGLTLAGFALSIVAFSAHVLVPLCLRDLADRAGDARWRDRAETVGWSLAGVGAALALFVAVSFGIALAAGQAIGGRGLAAGFGLAFCVVAVLGLALLWFGVSYLVLLEQSARDLRSLARPAEEVPVAELA